MEIPFEHEGGPTYGHFQQDFAVQEMNMFIIDESGGNFKRKL